MSKGKTITKEIRIHIHDDRCWIEYETKTGKITKLETLGGLVEATAIANTRKANAEEWTKEETEER